jgi:FlaA1/EpsC-like NDP-sugar epimerase
MNYFNLTKFVHTHITGRTTSMFAADIAQNHALLSQEIQGKSVLVIGGAGSIGSSYIKALLPFEPSRVVVIDTNENGLTELVRDVRSTPGLFVPDSFITYPINFGDPIFEKIFLQAGPFDIVANFSAHKHVRSEKDQFSVMAMIENNVLRAKTFMDLLERYPPKHFFCVSTDKAANPVNVMGASKKLMEDLVLSYSQSFKITTARFANVAFSNGSLLQGFLERMMKQQPFSSPADVRRYFVSLQESGEICMLACILGETTDIFFPKLKESDMKRFSDIAVSLLSDMGYEPDYCQSEAEAREKMRTFQPASGKYPVYFFQSDTSGEKMYEEFYVGTETLDMDRFQELGVIKDTAIIDRTEMADRMLTLRALFDNPAVQKNDIVAWMTAVIPDFHHIETGKYLDQKM